MSLYQCSCGKDVVLRNDAVRSGFTRSCGCLNLASLKTKPRHVTHGKSHLPEFNVWQTMKARCSNPNVKSYKYYGGRGISVCDRWQDSFELFLQDMGQRPSPKHSIERINNNGNYEPANCKWATVEEQSKNKRPRRLEAA